MPIFTPFANFQTAVGGIVTDGLQLWYDVSEGSQAGALTNKGDAGASYDGTLTNGELVYNTTNDWWDLDGTDYNPNIATNYGLDYAGTFTFEMWVNIDSGITATGGNGFIHDRTGSNPWVALGFNNTNGRASIYWINSVGTAYFVEPTTGNDWRDSTWHHFLATHNSSRILELYVDGNSLGTSSATVGSNNSGRQLRIMGLYLTSTRYYSNASFGSSRVYNIALTSDQVLQNFNAEKAYYGL